LGMAVSIKIYGAGPPYKLFRAGPP